MIQNIETYILLFTIYAVIGWLMEVSLSFIQHHKFINRGFLIGPYCPIYGFGGVAITLLLSNFMNIIDNVSIVDSLWISTIVIMFICGTLEYATSFVMEKLFHARWWDYHRFKFNINGRVCLETLLPFTIIGQIILRYANPVFLGLIGNIHQPWLHICTIVILAIFAIDVSVSYNIIHSFKKISNEAKDNTEEITKKVKDIISKTWRGRRLVTAFPNVNIEVIREKIRKKVEESKKKIEKRKEEIGKIIEEKTKKNNK
jgi:membrane protein